MDSITKNRQSLDVLRAMVSRGYGPDQVPEDGDWVQEMGHGWFNVAYRIRLRDGAGVVLKIAPPPHVEVMTYERGAMATELAALALIREHTTVPVPAVDFADRSHELCDAPRQRSLSSTSGKGTTVRSTPTGSSCRSSTPTTSASSRTPCPRPNVTRTTRPSARPPGS